MSLTMNNFVKFHLIQEWDVVENVNKVCTRQRVNISFAKSFFFLNNTFFHQKKKPFLKTYRQLD